MRLTPSDSANVLGVERIGGAESKARSRRWSGNGLPSRYGQVIHDQSRSLATCDHGRRAPLRRQRSGFSVYVLNMGQALKIVVSCRRMIRLSGLEPRHDIDNRSRESGRGGAAERNPVCVEEPAARPASPASWRPKPKNRRLQSLRKFDRRAEQAIARDDRATIKAVLRIDPGIRVERCFEPLSHYAGARRPHPRRLRCARSPGGQRPVGYNSEISYITFFCFSAPISSVVNPNSASTSSVCSPNPAAAPPSRSACATA